MSEDIKIKMGGMPESKLRDLKYQIELELRKREDSEESKDYIEVIYCDDGSEGFYCPLTKWNKIPAKKLKSYIMDTIRYGSNCSFTVEKFEKEEYVEELKRYEWNF